MCNKHDYQKTHKKPEKNTRAKTSKNTRAKTVEGLLQDANPMAGVFQNIDPPPPHRPASVYHRLWCGGRTHLLVGEGGGGSIFWKTSDTGLFST